MLDNYKYEALCKIIDNVSRETFNNLLLYEQEILKWQKNINLISKNTIDQIWQRHILDSAQLYNYTRHYKTCLDIGSGGGFPAIVLAILYKKQANFQIIMVEKLQKKAAFLQYMISKLKLPAIAEKGKIENIIHNYTNIELVTSRACAELTDIFTLAEPAFSAGAIGLLQKGKNVEQELLQAHKNWSFNVKKHISSIETSSIILEVSHVKRKFAPNE